MEIDDKVLYYIFFLIKMRKIHQYNSMSIISYLTLFVNMERMFILGLESDIIWCYNCSNDKEMMV